MVSCHAGISLISSLCSYSNQMSVADGDDHGAKNLEMSGIKTKKIVQTLS